MYLFICDTTAVLQISNSKSTSHAPNLIPHTFTSFQVLKNESIVLILDSYFCLFYFQAYFKMFFCLK